MMGPWVVTIIVKLELRFQWHFDDRIWWLYSFYRLYDIFLFFYYTGDLIYLQGRIILASTLDEVDRIHGMWCPYIIRKNIFKYFWANPIVYLNSIKCSFLPNHQLKFKVYILNPILLSTKINFICSNIAFVFNVE